MLLLHVKQNYFEIFLKLFKCFISHVTTSETEINYFSRCRSSEVISKVCQR